MDLSINKINLKNSIKFKGLKGDLDKENTPVFKFYPPAYDKKNEAAFLEFAFVKTNEKTGKYIPPEAADFEEPEEFKNGEPIELLQKAISDETDTLAYRYVIKNKNKNIPPRYIIDNSRTLELEDKSKVNLITVSENYGVTPKTGPIRHSFVDSDAILLNRKTLKSYDPNFVRNHFNKLGGTISGLTYLLENTDELDPYRYILSTPKDGIGADDISSHGYWPFNQYQCGDLNEFKNFNFQLFRRGKGYIADGAFTSQGLQSPIVQHVLKWGKESPFYNMLKVDANLEIGVLPDRSVIEGIGKLDHIGVKMVNNPHRKDYDSSKATYIQFFDTRLVQDETRDKNELIKEYDKAPEDHYDVTNHQNSVIPYYFEVKTNDKTRVNKFIDKDYITLNELKEQGELSDFLTFENFSIVSKAHAAGANYWDGSRDIIKMNLSNPTGEKANREGFFNARNYILGVASYWSELVQSDLILQSAKLNEKDKKETAKNNEIGDWDKFKESIANMSFPVLEQNKSVEDYIKEFPMQSIKTDATLSAIFSEPDFQNEFFDKYTVKQISNIVNSALDNIIPDKYANNSEYRTYATKVYANKLITNLLVGAMCPNALNDKGEINPKELEAVSLYSLNAQDALNVEEERRIVENKIKRAINPDTLKGTIETLTKEMDLIELEDFKTAEAMVLQGKGGLNWRFDASKDIGDLDSIRDKNATFEHIWDGDEQTPGVVDFWTDFVRNAKKYNPSAYIISELTCMGDFPGYIENDNELEDYNRKMAALKMSRDDMFHENEARFVNKTGSTTISNYSEYFNHLSMFIGENPEKIDGDLDRAVGSVEELKKNVDSVLFNSQPNAAILCHSFVDNHDKPRLLHTMPLDPAIFMSGYLDKGNQIKISSLTGRNDYENMAPTAMAVGLAMKDLIDARYGKSEKAEALTKSLSNLVNGKKDDNSEPDYRRADAFGHLPYEVTIRDMFKGAGYGDEEEDMLDFRYDLVKNSIKYEIKLWEVMNAIVGSPTLFNGTEFFQTGYESPSHNFYVANRNQTMHEMKDDKRFAKHYQTMQNITSLYKTPALRAIRDGFTTSGKIIGPTGYDASKPFQIWPIYQDNGKGSKVISLITNNGIPKGHVQNSEETNKLHTMSSLTVNFGEDVLEDGMTMERVYLGDDGKYVFDHTKYTVKKPVHVDKETHKKYTIDGEYVIKPPQGEKIRLYGTVERFYVPTETIKGQF